MSTENRFQPPRAGVADVRGRQSSQYQPVRIWSAAGRIGRLRYLGYLMGGYLVVCRSHKIASDHHDHGRLGHHPLSLVLGPHAHSARTRHGLVGLGMPAGLYPTGWTVVGLQGRHHWREQVWCTASAQLHRCRLARPVAPTCHWNPGRCRPSGISRVRPASQGCATEPATRPASAHALTAHAPRKIQVVSTARCADFGLKAAHTLASVSMYGPPIKSMQYGTAAKMPGTMDRPSASRSPSSVSAIDLG
jgi:hypothetical protein